MNQKTPHSGVELGITIGRGQTFGLVASQCAAAQAECLRNIRSSRAYEQLGLTWSDFCHQHAGITDSHADGLIRRLEEFGATYFRLSEIIRISPAAYRQIAGAVHGETIEIGGEAVPITPENAPRIRAAVQALRAGLRKARSAPQFRPQPNIINLQTRLDTWCSEISALIPRDPSRPVDNALRGLITYARRKLERIDATLSQPLV